MLKRYTRGADCDQFLLEQYNTMKYKDSACYKGTELWKLLPLDIVTSDSIFQLKTKLKARNKTFADVLY